MPDPKPPVDRRTRVGYQEPHDAGREERDWNEATSVDPIRAFRLDEFAGGTAGRVPHAEPAVKSSAPAVEVTFVHDTAGLDSARRGPWCAVEVWTQNRVYMLDATMTCIEVRGRASGVPETTHSLLGARLTGGQLREGNTLEISHPFPVPGSEAMFQHPPRHRVRFGQTSKVERVLLRVRISTVALSDADEMWAQITGRPLER